jgi:outer membrane protein
MEFIMKLFSYLCFLIVFISSSLLFADVKIGYVDFQFALNTVEEGIKAKESLTQEYNKKKAELESKQNALTKLKTELETQGSILSEDAKKKKGTEFNEKMMEFQKITLQYEKEMQARQIELTEKILKELKTISEKIAKDEKFTFILEKNESGIVFAEKTLDLTNKVVKIYNTNKKKS